MGERLMGDAMMGDGMMGAFMGSWMLVELLVLASLVAAVAWLAIPVARLSSDTRPEQGAMAELRSRYARGEIGREDFLAIRRDLEEHTS